MKVNGQLEIAQYEHRTSDPTGADLVLGRVWYRTDAPQMVKWYDGTAVQSAADLTTAQTLLNKTFSNPLVTGATTFAESATPANPAASNYKVYPKVDGKLYILNNAGVESQVGASTTIPETVHSTAGTISMNTITALNTWQNISGTPNTVLLTPGTWDTFYKYSIQLTYLSGTLPYSVVYNMALADAAGTTPVVATEVLLGVTFTSSADSNYMVATGHGRIVVSSNTSYKVIHRVGSGNAITGIRASATAQGETGLLSSNDNESYIWAIKVAN